MHPFSVKSADAIPSPT